MRFVFDGDFPDRVGAKEDGIASIENELPCRGRMYTNRALFAGPRALSARMTPRSCKSAFLSGYN